MTSMTTHQDSTTGRSEATKGTNNAIHTAETTLRPGEIDSTASLGYLKMNSLATSVGFTSIPNGATIAIVQCETADVRWRADAVAPTATDGMLLPANAEITFTSLLSSVNFIQTAAGAVLHISFF